MRLRLKTTEKPLLGYAQIRALKLLTRTRANSMPKPGAITPTGVLRRHIYGDLALNGCVEIRHPKRGAKPEVQILITAKGRRLAREAQVMRAPRRSA